MKKFLFVTAFLFSALSVSALQKIPASQVSVQTETADGLTFDAQSNPVLYEAPVGTLQLLLNNLEVDETILRKAELEDEFNATFPDVVPNSEDSLSTDVVVAPLSEDGSVTIVDRDMSISFPNVPIKTVVVGDDVDEGTTEIDDETDELTIQFPHTLDSVVKGDPVAEGDVSYDKETGALEINFPEEEGVTDVIVNVDQATAGASIAGNELTIDFPEFVPPPIVYDIEGFIPKKESSTLVQLTPGRGSVKGNFFYRNNPAQLLDADQAASTPFGFVYVYASASITSKVDYDSDKSLTPTYIILSETPPEYDPFYGQWYASAADNGAQDANGVPANLSQDDVLLALYHTEDNATSVGDFYAFRGSTDSSIKYFMSGNLDQTVTGNQGDLDVSATAPIHHDLSYFYDIDPADNYGGGSERGEEFPVNEIVTDTGTDLASGKTPKIDNWYSPLNLLSGFTPVNATRARLSYDISLAQNRSLYLGFMTTEALNLSFSSYSIPFLASNSDMISEPYSVADGGDEFSLFDGSSGHKFIRNHDHFDQNQSRYYGSDTFWIDLGPSRDIKMTFGNLGYNRDNMFHLFRLTTHGFEFSR